jgi:histidyl-tRNA synthetase
MFEGRKKVERKIIENNDIFPDDHKYLTFLKKVFRHEFRRNGFRRIWTDILENGKFRELAETGIVKAYLNNNKMEEIQPVYYYYMDHFMENWVQTEKIGWEIIWENDPILDALSIYLTYTVLNEVWLKDKFSISINSTWILKEKTKYIEELQNFYADKKQSLSEESLNLIESNPERIFLSKDEDDKILSSQAPDMIKFLKKDSKLHYNKIKEFLELLKVPFNENKALVWNNDYSTNSIWEFRWDNDELIWNGSRHNKLAESLWEPKEIPASWFSVNIKTIMNLMRENNIQLKNKDQTDLFFVQLWDEAKSVVLPLSIDARKAGINTVLSIWTPSMKEQMLKATRSKSRFIVLVALMEARNGIFQVKDTLDGTQEEVKKEELIEYIINKIWKERLDFYVPTNDLIIS